MKLVIFGLLMLMSLIVGAGISLIINPDVNNAIELKLIQGISQLMLFVVPTLLFSYLVSYGPSRYYNLNNKINPQHIVLTVLFLVILSPMVGYLTYINSQMVLPDFLSGVEDWMRDMEDKNWEATLKIANAETFPVLLLTLVVMAVMPALGEELFFRGFLQKLFQARFKNPHAAIWVTAFLFSAFHVQFYGFIPRLLMGAALGYTYLWTRNLWMPILLHFLNNSMAVLSFYIYNIGATETKPEDMGVYTNPWLFVSLVVILGVFVRWFYLNRVKDNDWPAQMGEL